MVYIYCFLGEEFCEGIMDSDSLIQKQSLVDNIINFLLQSIQKLQQSSEYINLKYRIESCLLKLLPKIKNDNLKLDEDNLLNQVEISQLYVIFFFKIFKNL